MDFNIANKITGCPLEFEQAVSSWSVYDGCIIILSRHVIQIVFIRIDEKFTRLIEECQSIKKTEAVRQMKSHVVQGFLARPVRIWPPVIIPGHIIIPAPSQNNLPRFKIDRLNVMYFEKVIRMP